MQKLHTIIEWQDYPSINTPLNAQNLIKEDMAIDGIDNRVIVLDSTKFDKSEAQFLVRDIEFDEASGIFKITHYNGASYTIDTLLEKLAINFDYDYQTQRLIIELSDGEKKYVDLSALLTQYEFLDSDTVGFTVDGTGRVTADIIEGSIQEKHLRPNYLADIKLESAKAESSKNASLQSAKESKDYADLSKSYSVGTNNVVRENDATDNAKSYYEQAKALVYNISYGNLEDKPSINGVTLEGNKTTSDLGLQSDNNSLPVQTRVERIYTLLEFWDIVTEVASKTATRSCAIRFQFQGDWGPIPETSIWANAIVSFQNFVGSEYGVEGKILAMTSNGFFCGFVSGGSVDTPDLSVTWTGPLIGAASDIMNNIVTFESNDALEASLPNQMPLMETKSPLKQLMKNLSIGYKNVRYLLKMLGTTDISTISDGTITGAISALNTGMELLWENPDPTSAFPAQTVALKSNSYDIYRVMCLHTGTASHVRIEHCLNGYSCYVTLMQVDRILLSRIITVENHVIARINDCNYIYFSKSAEAVSNGSLIPYAIYGLR